LAVITAGTWLRSAGSQAGMTTWTLRPNGGHVTCREAVRAKREEDGPAAPSAPPGFAPSGWKVAGGAEPHATTSVPTPASKAPRGPRHRRHPPPSAARTAGNSTNGDLAVCRASGADRVSGGTYPAGGGAGHANGRCLARQRGIFWPAGDLLACQRRE